jgi:hypothetical protein
MKGTRVAFGALMTLAIATGALSGCSKGDSAASSGPKVHDMGGGRSRPTAVAATTDPAANTNPDESHPRSADPPGHVDIATMDAAPQYYTVTTKREGGAAQQVDPDLAIIAAAKASAASCFTGISDGSNSRSATIQVTVVPSGSVTRSDVSSPNTAEPGILSCLQSVADGLHFADKPNADIRAYSINVVVTRSH